MSEIKLGLGVSIEPAIEGTDESSVVTTPSSYVQYAELLANSSAHPLCFKVLVPAMSCSTVPGPRFRPQFS